MLSLRQGASPSTTGQTMNITTQAAATKYFSAKVRAFSDERAPAVHQIAIDPDGTVRVYDDVAQHYTIHHSLTPRQMEALRNS